MTVPLTQWQSRLAVLCGLLFCVLFYEVVAPVGSDRTPVIALASPKPFVPPAPFVMPPAEQFAIIDKRPVFLASRQPVATSSDEKQGAKPAAPPPLPAVTLLGVIIDGETKLALVKSASDAMAQSLAAGATLGGWTISAIAPDGITLHVDGFADQHIGMNAPAPASSTAPGFPAPAIGDARTQSGSATQQR